MKKISETCGRSTYHVDKLREFQLYRHSKNVTGVHNGSDEFVVTGQQIVVQPLGVRIPRHQQPNDHESDEYEFRPHNICKHKYTRHMSALFVRFENTPLLYLNVYVIRELYKIGARANREFRLLLLSLLYTYNNIRILYRIMRAIGIFNFST